MENFATGKKPANTAVLKLLTTETLVTFVRTITAVKWLIGEGRDLLIIELDSIIGFLIL